MPADAASIEVFVDEGEGVESVGLVLRGASIVDYDGEELTPACRLEARQARGLAAALLELANQIEGVSDDPD
ncbi:MAG TPA: hypothetical protein VFA33_07495 [Bryobacteraceae bacterium]|nr:hypothetical protein [Bryobacteraceae bacterium]